MWTASFHFPGLDRSRSHTRKHYSNIPFAIRFQNVNMIERIPIVAFRIILFASFATLGQPMENKIDAARSRT